MASVVSSRVNNRCIGTERGGGARQKILIDA